MVVRPQVEACVSIEHDVTVCPFEFVAVGYSSFEVQRSGVVAH